MTCNSSHHSNISRIVGFVGPMILAGAAFAGRTTLVSVGTGGTPPNCGAVETHCYSIQPDITPDGRYVVFSSVAQNITDPPHTPTPILQILIHDRLTCTTTRISETATGQPADKPCNDPSISADGQFVVFTSGASNLWPGVPNLINQIYLWDAATNTIELISKSAAGVPGTQASAVPTISDDGRWIVFQSDAPNLVPGDTNNQPDIFLYDRHTSTLKRVNLTPLGQQANGASRRPSMSPDGRYIVFDSTAQNLTSIPTNNVPQVFVLDRDSDGNGIYDEPGKTSLTLASVNNSGEPSNGFASWGVISPDGRLVAFSGSNTATNLVPGDTNNATDVFVRNLETGTTTRANVRPNGEQSAASAYFPFSFSADGRYLTFHSAAQDLIEGGHNGATHIWRRDLTTGENLIISRNWADELADNSSEVGVITADGNTVAFTSAAYNMIPGGTTNPNWVNVYVRQLRPTDLNGDSVVDVNDLLLLIGQWGSGACAIADVNGDSVVDVNDLLDLIGDWGS